MRSIVVPVVTFVMLIVLAPRLIASEADELREKVQAMKRQAAELKERGRVKAAEDLARKAAELVEAAERMEGKRPKVSGEEVEKLQGLLRDLREKQRRMKESGASPEELAEMQVRIAKTEAELDRLHLVQRGYLAGGRAPERPRPEMMAKLEEAGRKIKHLRIAAENLREAGADDIARQLMEKAEVMEREAREAKMRMMEEAKHRGGPETGGLPAQIEELRREVGRLREEMKELGQHVKELERARK
jgi:hypothetical protein